MIRFLLCVLLGVISCYGKNTNRDNNQPIPLSSEQKTADIKFFFDFVRENYPFVESIVNDKKLPSIYSFEKEYVDRAAQTRDNKEFIELFAELIQMLRQGTCHANIVEGVDLPADFDTAKHAFYNDISIESFKLNKYWWELLDIQNKFSNADIQVKYYQGKYLVAEDYKANGCFVSKGSVITNVDGYDINQYVKRLQNKIWLRLDDSLQVPFSFQPSPFVTFGNTSKQSWIVEFKGKNGEVTVCPIPKKMGFKDVAVYPSLMENLICRKLAKDVAYIKLFRFPPVSEALTDLKIIQRFFHKGNSFTKLIIDIRNNDGGSKTYGEELLFKPLLKDTITMIEYASVKKSTYDKLSSKRKTIFKMEGDNFDIQHGFGSISNIGFENLPRPIRQRNSKDTNYYYFKSETTYFPENKINFSGEIIILTDNDCVSACDGLARTFQLTNTAKIVGTNTQGGAAVVLPTWIYELPNSHILFRLEVELAFNIDGTINELFGTKPNINLDPSTYPTSFPKSFEADDLLHDDWIKKIILNK